MTQLLKFLLNSNVIRTPDHIGNKYDLVTVLRIKFENCRVTGNPVCEL